MKMVVVFGAGLAGMQYIINCPSDEKIVAIVDNNWENINKICGYEVSSPDKIIGLDFDKIVIAIGNKNKTQALSVLQIFDQLKNMGVDESKMIVPNENAPNLEGLCEYGMPRIQFIYDFAKLVCTRNIEGSLAECGVWRGDYAYHINNAFPDRKLYLFDTFEGFPEEQLEIEDDNVRQKLSSSNQAIKESYITHETLAFLKCKNRENGKIIIKKGRVPDTFADMPDDRFVYVQLDMDIYVPTIAALHYFAKRMTAGGVIAVHDYYAGYGFWTGVRKALDEFLVAYPLTRAVPIGDGATLLLLF